jgi:hypothetical protein
MVSSTVSRLLLHIIIGAITTAHKTEKLTQDLPRGADWVLQVLRVAAVISLLHTPSRSRQSAHQSLRSRKFHFSEER